MAKEDESKSRKARDETGGQPDEGQKVDSTGGRGADKPPVDVRTGGAASTGEGTGDPEAASTGSDEGEPEADDDFEISGLEVTPEFRAAIKKFDPDDPNPQDAENWRFIDGEISRYGYL